MSKGILIYATGEKYIRQAYLCALSVKASGNTTPVSLFTDKEIENKNNIFDKIIVDSWPVFDSSSYQVLNRWKTYHYTPYDETIVLDADTLVLQDILDWWSFFGKFDLFFPTQVYTYRNVHLTSDYYRKAFVENSLPNIYTGIHYFKKGDTGHLFFKWLETVSNNWELFYGNFCKEHYPKVPSMDLSTAIVTKILELDKDVTNYKINFLKFVHMKLHAQDWQVLRTDRWIDQVGIYLTKDLNLIIGNYLQSGIFHYVEDDFVTDEMVQAFEKKVLL